MNQKKVPQLFVATGATKWNDPKHFPWTMGWQPNYQSEGRIYAQYILEHQPEGEDRHPLPERRLRQGLPEGPQGRARRQGEIDDRRRGALRDDRPDRRFADRQPEGGRRRRLCQHRHAEIRRAGDQKGRRDRLEAVAHSEQRSATRSARVLKPAGLENAKGIVSDCLLQGPDRSAMERRSGLQGMARVHGQVLPGRRQDRRLQRLSATASRRRWCRCSSNAATTSRARTS